VLKDTATIMSASPKTISTYQILLHHIDFQLLRPQEIWNRNVNHIDEVTEYCNPTKWLLANIKHINWVKGHAECTALRRSWRTFFTIRKLQKRWKFPQFYHQREAMQEIRNQSTKVRLYLRKITFLWRQKKSSICHSLQVGEVKAFKKYLWIFISSLVMWNWSKQKARNSPAVKHDKNLDASEFCL
jgi:hypothetical protein